MTTTLAADLIDLDPETCWRVVRAAERLHPENPGAAAEPVSWDVRIDVDVVRRILAPQSWIALLLASDLHTIRTAISMRESLTSIGERFQIPTHVVEHIKRRSERSANCAARRAKAMRAA